MAKLIQSEKTEMYYLGWYGSCADDCASLDITIPFIRDKIFKIYQVNSQNNGYSSFDATLPASFDSILQFFTKLECGKSYIIILKPGTGVIDLPQFTSTKIDTIDSGRVVEDCFINITPTPTITPTVTSTPTPTPTPPVTPQPTPTPSATREPLPPSLCEGYPYTVSMQGDEVVDNQISFTMFPANSRICHWGSTGGPPDLSLIRLSGSPAIIGKIVANGSIRNVSIKYISPSGKIYRGSFKNNGIYTDMVLV